MSHKLIFSLGLVMLLGMILVKPPDLKADLACGVGETCPAGSEGGYNWYECRERLPPLAGTCYEVEHVDAGTSTCQLWSGGTRCTLGGSTGVNYGGCDDYNAPCDQGNNYAYPGCCPSDTGGGGGTVECTAPGQLMESCEAATGNASTGLLIRYYHWFNGAPGEVCTPGAPGGYFCHLWEQNSFMDRFLDGVSIPDGNCWGIVGITYDGYINFDATGQWNIVTNVSNETDQRNIKWISFSIDGNTVFSGDNTNEGNVGERSHSYNISQGWHQIHLELARDGEIDLWLKFGRPANPGNLFSFTPPVEHPCPWNPSCSINLSAGSITAGQSVTNTVTGNANTDGASVIRTILVKRDAQPIVPIPPGYAQSASSGMTYYTNADNNCTSTNHVQCTKSNTTTFATPGDYYFFCDSISSNPRCSGNVFCSINSGDVSPPPQYPMTCDGWQSCSPVNNSDWKYLQVVGSPTPTNTPTPSSTIPIPTTAPEVTIQGHIVDCDTGLDTNSPSGVGVSITGPESRSYTGGSFWRFDTLPTGIYDVIANNVVGYDVSYATCGVNCATGPVPAGPWIVNNTVSNVNLPANGNYADIYFKYCLTPIPPAEVTIMGWHKDPLGNNFPGGPVSIIGPRNLSNAFNPWDFTTIPAGPYSVSTSYPAGFSVSYRACINNSIPFCPAPTIGVGSSLNINLPNNGNYADIYFIYTSPTPTPTPTNTPTPTPTNTPTPTPTPVVMIQGRHRSCGATPEDLVLAGQNVTVSNASGTVTRTSAASPSWFFNSLPGETYTVTAANVVGYSTSHVSCINGSVPACPLPVGPYTPGNSVAVSLPNNGNYADVYFCYTPICNALAVPANFAVSVQCRQNVLTWSAVTGAAGYTVQRRPEGSATWTTLSAGVLGTSYTDAAGTCDQNYYYRVKARNTSLCTPTYDSLYTAEVGPRVYQCPPRASGDLFCQDTGGDVLITWPNTTDTGAQFNIYRGSPATLIGTVGNMTTSYADSFCNGLTSYEVRAYDPLRSNVPAPGCRLSALYSYNCLCNINIDSWWAASGGGNLVAATGRIQSKLPASTYLMGNAEGSFPGIAIGDTFGPDITSTKVNSKGWLYDITAPGWGSTGNRFLSDRENLYKGMWDRIVPRVTPLTAATNTVDATGMAALLSSSTGHKLNVDTGVDVTVIHWTGNMTIGNLDMGSNKVLLLVDGNATINGPITWTDSLGGFMAILAQGNIYIDPVVGTLGSANIINLRNPAEPANLKGIYYAQGVVYTGHGVGEDKLLKVEGTVVGMGGVSLQRVNKGTNPVEFFQFRPDLSEFLGRIGLRRRVVNQLLNP